MGRVSSFLLVRRGYDLLLWANGFLGACYLFQAPHRTNTTAAYRSMMNVLDPVLPGYYLRWLGALLLTLAVLGYLLLIRGHPHPGAYVRLMIATVYLGFSISAVVGAYRYAAGWSAAVIWLTFVFAHIQAATRDQPLV